MIKNWRDPKEYAYMKKHTPELWAWEFLRRNPDYNRDWKRALSAYLKGVSENKFQIKNEIKSVFFRGAREKWGLFQIDQIINPAVDKPYNDLDFPIFYTYGNLYTISTFKLLSNLKDSEALARFDLTKPIEQQLEYFGKLLKEEQRLILDKYDINIQYVINKASYWIDHLRRFDAVESKADMKDIVDKLFKGEDHNLVLKKVKNSYGRVLEMFKGRYLQILQIPRTMKPRETKKPKRL